MNDVKKEQIERNSPLPLYYQLKEQIKRKIKSGEWKVGESIPSEENLCQRYGISRGTVRQAISDLENEGLLVRRHGYGTYVASGQKKGQKIRFRTKTVGFIAAHLRDSFVSGILSGINDVVHKTGYSLAFATSQNLPGQQKKEIVRLRERGAEGLLIFPADGSVGDSLFTQLKAEGYPFVLVDRYFKDLETDYVVSDNLSGGYQATRHLIELGHKRIGFIAGSTSGATSTEERFNGYLKALKEFNILFDKSLLKIIIAKDITSPKKIHGQTYTIVHYDMKAIESFLSRKNRPTSIFAVNDLIALDTLKVAKKLHLSVPEDLSIVGFDNIDIVSHLEIPLTTIHQSKYEMGVEAAKILIKKIENKENSLKKVILPTQLLIRKSCTVIS